MKFTRRPVTAAISHRNNQAGPVIVERRRRFLRKKAGSKGVHLVRDVDKPKETVMLVKWNRLDRARKFAKSRELRAAPKRAGVVDRPDIYFHEEVDRSRA